MKRIRYSLFSFICLFLASCGTPADQTLPIATTTSAVTSTATPVTNCQTTFEHRELREPYKRNTDGQPRFTLDKAELDTYLEWMGISNMCIPVEVGAPFVNADWNSAVLPSVRGRMVSLGFEETYTGSGWSDIYLVHSTYDFTAGTEYDRFMTGDEWTAFKSGALDGVELLPDGRGFIRYKAGLYFGNYPIYKTYVYPGETGYSALVINLGTYSGEFDAEVEKLKQGGVPEEMQRWLPVFNRMANLIR